LERAHLVSRSAYAALVVLVFAFLSFAITAAFVTKGAARDAADAVQLSDHFSGARFDVAAEESLERKYRLEPSPHARDLHRQAAQQLEIKLRAARAAGGTSAVDLVNGLLVAHGHYLTATDLLFAAVDAHRTVRASAIEHLIVDPVFGNIQTAVDNRAKRSRQVADIALGTLRHTQDLIIMLTLVVSCGATIALGVILIVLRHYKQQVDSAIFKEMGNLKTAALTDYLTGLGNHRAYQEDLHKIAADVQSDENLLTVALLDVDELKALNDREGHASGDRVLTSLAKVLRASDLQAVPYRLGGDQFALIFPGMALQVARVRVEHVRRIVEAEPGGTTVSVGLATSNDAASDLLVLREQADTALFEAKRRGRNTVVAFDDIRDEAAMFLPARIHEVRDLISRGTMGVAFQPIWDVRAINIIGYEALARPAGKNPINPQDAFDIAERIGKAHDLDRICRTAVLERAQGLPADALLFINVSPQSLDHEEFAGNALIKAVAAAGMSPDRVVLEITERSIARLPVVVREARRLRALGFALALDDAGSGNSGLEMLSQLPVDYVKIDREVIVRAQTGGGGRAVLAGIVAIAQEMGAQIIAEGIEDADMLNLVKAATRWSPIACAVQGYYVGRPDANFVDANQRALFCCRLAAGADVETAGVPKALEVGAA